jgi:hypothetical protein
MLGWPGKGSNIVSIKKFCGLDFILRAVQLWVRVYIAGR